MRPLVFLSDTKGSELIYGIQTAGESMNFVLTQIEKGWLRQENIVSSEMKKYIGRTAYQKGNDFAEQVSSQMSNIGWFTRCKVELKSMGAPSELGDVDVFAWKDRGTQILSIECKRLKPARTIGEIGEQMAKFQGEAGDELGRHLRRLEWLKQNPGLAGSFLGIQRADLDFVPYLVTDTIVPMQFTQELPLPVDSILPIASLDRL